MDDTTTTRRPVPRPPGARAARRPRLLDVMLVAVAFAMVSAVMLQRTPAVSPPVGTASAFR
ncbi:hypothetical protein [Prosthecomicrobium sp. N25]|uniref:hypothetical protein n=1 Tax=Prosthecomicrobium sp. N25 TaxID=3129254 RepID=UPI003076B9CC